MIRGERPIKLRDSWFSAKSILVERLKKTFLQVELSVVDGKILFFLLKLIETSNFEKRL